MAHVDEIEAAVILGATLSAIHRSHWLLVSPAQSLRARKRP